MSQLFAHVRIFFVPSLRGHPVELLGWVEWGNLWGRVHRIHARGEGERVLALESREGTRASRRVEEGLSRSLSV